MRRTTANTNRIMEMMLIIVGFLIYASKGGPKKEAALTRNESCLSAVQIHFLCG
jgi:hypothetical protein